MSPQKSTMGWSKAGITFQWVGWFPCRLQPTGFHTLQLSHSPTHRGSVHLDEGEHDVPEVGELREVVDKVGVLPGEVSAGLAGQPWQGTSYPVPSQPPPTGSGRAIPTQAWAGAEEVRAAGERGVDAQLIQQAGLRRSNAQPLFELKDEVVLRHQPRRLLLVEVVQDLCGGGGRRQEGGLQGRASALTLEESSLQLSTLNPG